ncbi:hypothetical protein ONS95_009775 [Cadophora gregata]|uniref:uncharacterized protein n=1 Tax=Cadophora gregata TaxID=51156 RepID=UPI0026DD4F3F|nr:uncharacterized protein ONS95_009775 [Cadophora gregata]KAK0121481.1 hypothetical protein ONS95_009775 [Cadophora gregata]
MLHGPRHNQSPGALGVFVNDDAAAHALRQQEARARYNHQRFLEIEHQVEPPPLPTTIQSPIHSSILRLSKTLSSNSTSMYRNTHRRQNPLSSRGRDQHEIPYHHIEQMVVEILSNIRERESRGLGAGGRSDWAPNYPHNYDPQSALPQQSFARENGRREQQAMRRTDQTHHSRAGMAGQGKEGEPLGKAMKKLHKWLVDVENAYGEFQGGFDEDTKEVKRYAKTTSLVDLWRRKFEGKNVGVPGEDEAEQDEQTEEFAERHSTMKQKLAAAMDTAILAKAGEIKGLGAAIRHENVSRLKEKVETAKFHIMDVMEKMPRDREFCVALLSELAVLKQIIDPEQEATKKLYQAGVADGTGDADEDEIGGVGGGSWEE